ncbi:AtpZ/AtpI family protein [Methylopila henanensis]|uniref:ATP synthase protein I n=1 Tax=Methylopila henanensis TaxID=873516 RepID=A0ABW4K7F6_9HYPH
MARESSDGGPERSDDDLSGRLDRLDKALSRHGTEKGGQGGTPPISTRDAQGFARAFRLSSEFIAGVVVGGGLGWALDRWLGTTPLAMIVFVLLGFAAGVLNVMRVAGLARHPGQDDRPPL